MSDELQRQALARSIAVRLQLLSHRDLQLIDEVVIRLCQRASESPRSRVAREAIDDLIAGVEASLAEQDADREQRREAARVEMLGAAARMGETLGEPATILIQRAPSARLREFQLSRSPVDGPEFGEHPDQFVPAGEWAPDLTRVSPDSAVIALGDERARDEELEVDVELASDPADEWDVSDVGGDVGGGA